MQRLDLRLGLPVKDGIVRNQGPEPFLVHAGGHGVAAASPAVGILGVLVAPARDGVHGCVEQATQQLARRALRLRIAARGHAAHDSRHACRERCEFAFVALLGMSRPAGVPCAADLFEPGKKALAADEGQPDAQGARAAAQRGPRKHARSEQVVPLRNRRKQQHVVRRQRAGKNAEWRDGRNSRNRAGIPERGMRNERRAACGRQPDDGLASRALFHREGHADAGTRVGQCLAIHVAGMPRRTRSPSPPKRRLGTFAPEHGNTVEERKMQNDHGTMGSR